MKRIRWSAHAEKECLTREISRLDVEKTLEMPDLVSPGRYPREIFMRRYFDEILQSEMLLRVVVEESETERVIVTLYKTSKFKKYEQADL